MKQIEIEPIIDAAKAGGKIIRAYFGQTLEKTQKTSISDFRTKADLESESTILSILEKHFPAFSIHSEEVGIIDKHSDYRFIIDPLDGTGNFSLGLPNFAVSIGLMHHNSVIAGVIYHPITEEAYHATKGAGAFIDGIRLRVNSESNITHAAVASTCGYSTKEKNMRQSMLNMQQALFNINVKRFIHSWAPTYDYCLLASGRIEAMINYGNELYDHIAGKLIMREAGAEITRFDGALEKDDASCYFLATNGTNIHAQILEAISEFI